MAAAMLGFIGLGQMGGPMAGRLLDAGYRLILHDLNEAATAPLVARGAVAVDRPAAVGDAAELVMTSLPTPEIVETVALGSGGLCEGTAVATLVDLSTIGIAAAQGLAEGLAEHEIQWVDAPVSGGIAGAKAGTLAIMPACPEATLSVISPPLEVLGRVIHVGAAPGLGQAVKLGNNLLSVAAVAIAAEALAMGAKAGVDPAVMVEVINAGTGRNSATEDKFPNAILPRRFDSGFSTGLAFKDVKLCVDEAEALGVPMVLGAALREIMAITQAKHGAGSDFTAVAKVLEDWAGVEIKGGGAAAKQRTDEP